MAVMNMPEETVVQRKQVMMRKEPIFFSVPLAGSEPAAASFAQGVGGPRQRNQLAALDTWVAAAGSAHKVRGPRQQQTTCSGPHA